MPASPASLRKYYKRSHKLILTRYDKLKGKNKEACDLMPLYNDDLRKAHMLKEWFYHTCQNARTKNTPFKEWNFMNGLRMRKAAGFRNSKNVLLLTDAGQNIYGRLLSTDLQMALRKSLTTR